MERAYLFSQRLHLRPFTDDDIAKTHALASDPRVAATSLNIPHPYPDTLAAEWIASHAGLATKGNMVFAITQRDDQTLLGSISLLIQHRHRRAELGYWIGYPYWGQGYATEATAAVVAWGFDTCGLNRIFAQHFANNPASGRVMQKAGLRYEGNLRQCVQKDGIFHDTAIYAILREDWVNCRP